MDSLVLTLGHNSSAIAIRDGQIIGGYETERLTGIKSDSKYPLLPIEKLLEIENFHPENIFIGHWFIDGNLPEKSNKYINYEHLNKLFPGVEIHSLSQEFTHHDSHLESAKVFAGDFCDSYHAFVMDGFGTFGECISIYQVENNSQKLIHRCFGFDHSLGMFYQYATAYMGMKQNNHEYKILAYEVNAYDYECADDIAQLAVEKAKIRAKRIIDNQLTLGFDPLFSMESLPAIQLAVSDELDEVCDIFGIDKTNEHELRILISWYTQTLVQTVVLMVLDVFKPKNILLSGGLFYNVKINSLIANAVKGKTCVFPLAGDQGAGLGVYQHYMGDLIWPNHLFWGHRNLDFKSDMPGLIVVDTEDDALPIIYERLSSVGFVNIVRGSMEFGPRALCNTSTIALPSKNVAEMINHVNDRTSEMPMAPFMSKNTGEEVFENTGNIHKSLDYMIIARNYKPEYCISRLLGAQHFYPDNGTFTGRPQMTDDPFLLNILNEFGEILINTSFNYHGHPIVFDETQIKVNHFKEYSRNNAVFTVVIKEK